jgi:hypothetical protein
VEQGKAWKASWFILVGLVACSSSSSSPSQQDAHDSGSSPPAPDGGAPGDMTDAATSAVAPETGAPEGGDAAGQAAGQEAGTTPAFKTNTPAATFMNASTAAVGDLVLLTSNLVEQPSGSANYYQQWFGDVKNVSTKIYCYVNIHLQISPGPGLPLALTSYADTAPYAISGSTLSASCLGPGETGAMYSNNISDSSANVASSTGFAYQFDGMVTPGAVPHPDAPMVTDALMNGNLGFNVQGTMTAVGAINNIEFKAYLRDGAGLLQDQVTDTDLNTLAAAGTWMFSTDYGSGQIVDHFDSVSFIDGVSTQSVVVSRPDLAALAHDRAQVGAQIAARARAARP